MVPAWLGDRHLRTSVPWSKNGGDELSSGCDPRLVGWLVGGFNWFNHYVPSSVDSRMVMYAHNGDFTTRKKSHHRKTKKTQNQELHHQEKVFWDLLSVKTVIYDSRNEYIHTLSQIHIWHFLEWFWNLLSSCELQFLLVSIKYTAADEGREPP